jgi:hypothetical protein
VSQSLPKTLSEGYITPAAKLTVELVDTKDMPQTILIRWPVKATPVSPRRYDEIASRAMRLLANASTQLAARKARKRTIVDDEEDEGDG